MFPNFQVNNKINRHLCIYNRGIVPLDNCDRSDLKIPWTADRKRSTKSQHHYISLQHVNFNIANNGEGRDRKIVISCSVCDKFSDICLFFCKVYFEKTKQIYFRWSVCQIKERVLISFNFTRYIFYDIIGLLLTSRLILIPKIARKGKCK